MTSLCLLLVGALIGVMSAMLGIGGGIVLVPALVILFGLSRTEAQGTSLATIPATPGVENGGACIRSQTACSTSGSRRGLSTLASASPKGMPKFIQCGGRGSIAYPYPSVE
jgi:hypothetical protein